MCLSALAVLAVVGCVNSSSPAGAVTAGVTQSWTPAPVETPKRPAVRRSIVVTQTTETYGADPLQVVTLRRDVSNPNPTKTVIFLHGGGWNAGGRGSLEAEATEWAKTGWVTINVSYRLGVIGGAPDDGKLILQDVYTVLQKYRAKSYVDPNNIVVYGESAGGHLATWAGSKYGAQVKAIVALSPVDSVQGAITAGETPGAPSKVVNLGSRAREFFGYSVGTTDSHRYLSRVQHAAVVIGVNPNEWVDPDIHGRAFCDALANRCELTETDGGLHAGAIADAFPQVLVDLRHWADRQLSS